MANRISDDKFRNVLWDFILSAGQRWNVVIATTRMRCNGRSLWYEFDSRNGWVMIARWHKSKLIVTEEGRLWLTGVTKSVTPMLVKAKGLTISGRDFALINFRQSVEEI